MATIDSAYVGDIAIFCFSYAPEGWTYCTGQAMQISQHQALYSLIGSYYGPSNSSIFYLPNFNSRMPMGATLSGTSPGLTSYWMGVATGTSHRTLTPAHMTVHTHTATVGISGGQPAALSLHVYETDADVSAPAGADVIAGSNALRFRTSGGFNEPKKIALASLTGTGTAAAPGQVTLSDTGVSDAFSIQSPALALQFSICMDGIYPPRP
ncbi:MAG: tail fiber protein [Thalassobaculaceae bacterium]|nr:tail fiber protein [Thalassobaculaceae bacterium]